jgi:hypothetical protein
MPACVPCIASATQCEARAYLQGAMCMHASTTCIQCGAGTVHSVCASMLSWQSQQYTAVLTLFAVCTVLLFVSCSVSQPSACARCIRIHMCLLQPLGQ